MPYFIETNLTAMNYEMQQYRTQKESDEAFNLTYQIVKQMSFIRQMENRMLKVEILQAEITENLKQIKLCQQETI